MHAVLSHWSASWPALVGYAVVAAAHLAGLSRLLTGRPLTARDAAAGRALRSQAAVFQGGLLIALLALVSPIGYWSDVFIWVRAVQFLLLAVVSTGLMVLGAPWLAFRAAIPGRDRGPATGEPGQPRTRSVPGDSERHRWLIARPGLAVVLVNVVWLGWQLPVLFDPARASSVVALACHACYLAAGLVFWLQLIGSRPLSPAASPLRRLRLVVGTAIATTLLGMVLAFGNGVLYPAYAGAAHHVMTVLDDQQLAGAVIWVGVLPALVAVGVALLLRWLGDEESAELSADLDRLLTPRKNAWSARPGIR